MGCKVLYTFVFVHSCNSFYLDYVGCKVKLALSGKVHDEEFYLDYVGCKGGEFITLLGGLNSVLSRLCGM